METRSELGRTSLGRAHLRGKLRGCLVSVAVLGLGVLSSCHRPPVPPPLVGVWAAQGVRFSVAQDGWVEYTWTREGRTRRVTGLYVAWEDDTLSITGPFLLTLRINASRGDPSASTIVIDGARLHRAVLGAPRPRPLGLDLTPPQQALLGLFAFPVLAALLVVGMTPSVRSGRISRDEVRSQVVSLGLLWLPIFAFGFIAHSLDESIASRIYGTVAGLYALVWLTLGRGFRVLRQFMFVAPSRWFLLLFIGFGLIVLVVARIFS